KIHAQRAGRSAAISLLSMPQPPGWFQPRAAARVNIARPPIVCCAGATDIRANSVHAVSVLAFTAATALGLRYGIVRRPDKFSRARAQTASGLSCAPLARVARRQVGWLGRRPWCRTREVCEFACGDLGAAGPPGRAYRCDGGLHKRAAPAK